MIWLYIGLGILFLLILPLFFVQFFVARHLYYLYFVRSENENWTRELTPTNDDEVKMYKVCEVWEKENAPYKKDCSIVSDGLKLMGEYYDFGFNKACLIVAGRSEALRYSYYFAAPYKKAGFNVLVIDNRSHGLSEGKYNSLGFKEYRDLLGWIKLLHDDFGNETVIGHGICIGSATLLYAITNQEAPDYFKGMVADGMYQNFVLSFNNHAHEAGHSHHFVSEFLFMLLKKHTKENPYIGPIDYMDKMNKPILFMYSLQDNYSTPDQGKNLFAKCASVNKKIAWFPFGTHSHIRVNDETGYDKVVIDFINENFS